MTPELAKDFAAYNTWMNRRIYEIAGRLSDAERRLDRGAFFKSIHGTLNHILLADKVWMGRLTGTLFTVSSLDQELHGDFAALADDRFATDNAISAFVSGLGDEVISGTLRYTSTLSPEPRALPMYLVLAHFFNHQTHHRGQLSTLLFQMGIDIGVTDLAFMPGADLKAST